MNKLLHGDCLERLKELEDNSVDSVVTDPPYGLGKPPDITEVLNHWLNDKDFKPSGGGFMNKGWDSFVPSPIYWKEVFRVLKPGGHLLCFAGTRTSDVMGIALRLAGFEIRDSISFIYGSGFPKSLNISKAIDREAGKEREVIGISKKGSGAQPNKLNNHGKGDTGIGYADGSGKEFNITAPATDLAKQYDGWGTALKPSMEPICLARKPIAEKTIAKNVMKYGTGGINIDGCRIATDDYYSYANGAGGSSFGVGKGIDGSRSDTPEMNEKGRFPANLIIDDSEEVKAIFPYTKSGANKKGDSFNINKGGYAGGKGRVTLERDYPASEGSASRFFYCSKASNQDRDEGLEDLSIQKTGCMKGNLKDGERLGSDGSSINTPERKNIHPTVKPFSLMVWLCRLVTPPKGIVLDPFMGSGSTGKAAIAEGFSFIGIEREKEYFEIAEKRINHAVKQKRMEIF